MTRSSFACADSDRSETSSRNSVPPSACSNFPAPPPHAGGRSLLDPEQLRLEQRLDHGRAIDRDERPAPSPAQLVNLARDELLARAALAFDQDGEVSRGDPLDTRPQRLHDGRRSNQRRNAWPRAGPETRTRPRATSRTSPPSCATAVQRVEVVFVEATVGVARRFENRLHACIRRGNTEDDRVGRARGSDEPGLIPRAHFSQSHRPKIERLPYLLLERDLEVLLADVRAQRVPQRDEQLPQPAQMRVSARGRPRSGLERHSLLQQAPHSPPTSTANATQRRAISNQTRCHSHASAKSSSARGLLDQHKAPNISRAGRDCPHPLQLQGFQWEADTRRPRCPPRHRMPVPCGSSRRRPEAARRCERTTRVRTSTRP